MFCPECGLIAEPGPLDLRSSLHQEGNSTSNQPKGLIARLLARRRAPDEKRARSTPPPATPR